VLVNAMFESTGFDVERALVQGPEPPLGTAEDASVGCSVDEPGDRRRPHHCPGFGSKVLTNRKPVREPPASHGAESRFAVRVR
jgi:hypothetical protein